MQVQLPAKIAPARKPAYPLHNIWWLIGRRRRGRPSSKRSQQSMQHQARRAIISPRGGLSLLAAETGWLATEGGRPVGSRIVPPKACDPQESDANRAKRFHEKRRTLWLEVHLFVLAVRRIGLILHRFGIVWPARLANLGELAITGGQLVKRKASATSVRSVVHEF